ncbi:sigma 54-interacting transcriptional regulator, partial [Hydrogenibacillus schlegelii]|uniref:sigma 54-interacting transcriptional regulator n=1 Tax=Hydrogenibacillus schlegelii TaxID=1484 RepID=UPI0023541564
REAGSGGRATGTGKGVVARAGDPSREFSRHAPFRKLNCTAFPPELLEPEHFGHDESAFFLG